MIKNKITIEGIVYEKPVLIHEVNEEKFYDFKVEVSRRSESKDIITVTVSNKVYDVSTLNLGVEVRVKGNVRTYNQPINEFKKIKLTLLAKEIEEIDEIGPNNNLVLLNGFVCKEPVYRVTQSGKRICDIMLAVNLNKYKSSYIPVILWEDNADKYKDLTVGDNIGIIGRLQSREYTKKIKDLHEVTNIAYEVSTLKVRIIKSKNYKRF